MKILAVDTATQGCSVAVTENLTLIAGFDLFKKETHSKHLMFMIDTVLEVSGMHIDDIDGFAITTGPGSFTGLRIGLSTIKGLAYVTGKPVVGISTLDALAYGAGGYACAICPMIDARKGEIYTSLYTHDESGTLCKTIEDSAVDPQEFLTAIDSPTLFIGTGVETYGHLIAGIAGDYVVNAPEKTNFISALTVAKLSVSRFQNGDVDDILSLEPTYLRKSDAELNYQAISSSS